MSSVKYLSSKFGHVVDGEKSLIPPGCKMMAVINPATEEKIAEVPIATKKELDQAVEAAHVAQKQWAKKSFKQRAQIIADWGKAYQESMPDLVDLLIAEQGKSRMVAEFEVNNMIKWFNGVSDVWDGSDEVVQEIPGQKVITKYSPLGVAAAIVPWNFPVILSLWKIIPCLYTGNAMIVKPSPFTPLCNIKIVEQAQEFLPKGLLQVIVGDDQLGPWVTEHPGIQKISFTGSTATGRLVARSCAATLKRMTLELGGNDSAIILPDVDVKTVAPQVLFGALMNTGQFCAASKRIYVHEKIYDEFSKAITEAAKGSPVGPGTDPSNHHGPINNKMQFDKVSEYFQDSIQNKHKFLCGGEIPKSQKGYFIPLTLVDNPPEGSRVVAEEPFGPIVPLLKWNDEEDLLKRVNDSEYGLGSSVWGKDLDKVEKIATAIESGNVWCNTVQNFDPTVPFGGIKNSGVGCENGKLGMKSYMNSKSVILGGLPQ